ncbi:uncharacterized protein LOC119376982 [Rhipicephalus sanguineus]|uniref:uncharacterized protein LOC119376982 n=1 Tax=Rhipicephalus sanguineus TaxID=34632 RepID=UPI0020C20F51|nr:uncharacterized protein LOC119376982 [Rhipicephalus sanguineus]
MRIDVSQMSKKICDLENRSRRNNIVVDGLKESAREDNATLLLLNGTHFPGPFRFRLMRVYCIHRVGSKKDNRERPVILRFYDFTEKLTILRNAFKLKDSSISISEDFSAEVRERRRKLWQSAKENRVALVFDKLKVGNQLFVWDDRENKRVQIGQAKRDMAKANSGTTA